MNSVTVDASHYERLVRDSVKYDQILGVLVKSVEFNKWCDGICFDRDILSDGLTAILTTSEYNDLKIRYEYLKQQYEKKLAREEKDEHSIE